MSDTQATRYEPPGVIQWLLGCILILVSVILGLVSLSLDEGIFKTLLGVCASFLGVSVVVSFLTKSFFAKREWYARQEEIRQIVNDAFDHQHGMNNRYGLTGFVEEMDYKALFGELGIRDELWWHDTYCPDYNGWLDDLNAALERGAYVRMLIQDPGCDNARHRAREIGGVIGEKYIEDLKQFVDAFKVIAKKQKSQAGRLEVAIYSDLPSIPIYVICRAGSAHKAYTSFFLGKATGLGFPHLCWMPGETDFAEYLREYVAEKWALARSLSDDKADG